MKLPPPDRRADDSLSGALATRRSCRTYASRSLSIADLSQLLWAAHGLTGMGDERTSPSAGGLYPLSVHVFTRSVIECPPGLHVYEPHTHSLERHDSSATNLTLMDTMIDDQPWVDSAPLVVFIVADMDRAGERFHTQPPRGQRGARYAYIETGAIAQNIQLQAATLGLGGVLVAGFDEFRLAKRLDLPGSRVPTTLLCLGYPA